MRKYKNNDAPQLSGSPGSCGTTNLSKGRDKHGDIRVSPIYPKNIRDLARNGRYLRALCTIETTIGSAHNLRDSALER